jgi:hypothetical protein
LEHHSNTGAELHRIDVAGIDILAVEPDVAGHAASLDGVVHAIEAAQEGRLAATGRSDQRRHRAVEDVEIDVE